MTTHHKYTRCVAAAALAVVYALNSGCLTQRIMDSKERQELGRLNLEREKAGLRPLSWDEYHRHGVR